MIKVIYFFLASSFFLSSILLGKEVGEEKKVSFDFEDLLAQTLLMQKSYSDLEFRHKVILYEEEKGEIKSSNHPLSLTLKNCLKPYFESQGQPASFNKHWLSCEQQLKALPNLSKNWSITIETLPFKYFAQEKLKEIDHKLHFILPEKQSIVGGSLSAAQWDSQSIIFNNSLPSTGHAYQYLGSNIIISFKNESLSALEFRNLYKINKKIEALLKLEPPMSLELNALNDKNPLLTLNYQFTYSVKQLSLIKLTIYPGTIYLAWPSIPIKNHQLILRQLQGGEEQNEVGTIEEIEFNYVEQNIKAKGKSVPDNVNELLLDALNLKSFITANAHL